MILTFLFARYLTYSYLCKRKRGALFSPWKLNINNNKKQMSKNIIVAIKTLQDVKDFIDSEDIRELLEQMSKLQSFLERFKDINHLSSKLREIEGLVYIGKEFLTIAEAAKYMGVSISKVYKMTSSGELVPHRLTGKMVYVLREDVNELIRKSRTATDEEIAAKADIAAQKYIQDNKADIKAVNKPDETTGKNIAKNKGKKGGKA